MNPDLANKIKAGEVVVMPTDTVYGIVGDALNKETVERIYELRKRNPEKPCIILISKISDLEKFGVIMSSEEESLIRDYWPGPVSIIFDCDIDDLFYLHRGTKSLAFRLPNNNSLIDFLNKTGPIIAPSANHEGCPVAKNIIEAKQYFGSEVLYLDGGEIVGKPSRVIRFLKESKEFVVIRE